MDADELCEKHEPDCEPDHGADPAGVADACDAQVRHLIDGVFEAGGGKGIAFAGALAAAEKDADLKEWVNVAGTSTGPIVAALLVVATTCRGTGELPSEAADDFAAALASVCAASPGDFSPWWS